MSVSKRILDRNKLSWPNGRPLHLYCCTDNEFQLLQESIRHDRYTAKDFVIWSAEQIRRNFRGGSLTWQLLFDAVGWGEDQGIGRTLTEKGLRQWGRKVRRDSSGDRMFLYTLMSEGGIPEALLHNSSKYRNVVLRLLKEVEAEGGIHAEPYLDRIAARWVQDLPQAFRNQDIARLLADLALALVRLRDELPPNLPGSAAVSWLDQSQPGWSSRLPLRMKTEIAETLIHPAIRAERDAAPIQRGPLCARELHLDQTGTWNGYLRFVDEGWLPEELFREAGNRRLRMNPASSSAIEGLSYFASHEDSGWRLSRSGSRHNTCFQYDLHAAFSLAAYADGRPMGEAVIDPGISATDVAPSFWVSAEQDEIPAEACRLKRSSVGRTRRACLWVLVSSDTKLNVSDGIDLAEPKDAPSGCLWRLSGKGMLWFSDRQYKIETGSADDVLDAAIIPFGRILPGWRLSGNRPVYHGSVTFLGRHGSSALRTIPDHEIRKSGNRVLFCEFVEWLRDNEVLDSCQIVTIPGDIQLVLKERTAGTVEFEAHRLPDGVRARLFADELEADRDVSSESVKLALSAPGKIPSWVKLRLSEPASGCALELYSHWPTTECVLLDPCGERLDANRTVLANSLHGWRAVVPTRLQGNLHLRMDEIEVALPIESERSISAHRPLIEAVLAQGGPDAQVALFVAADVESKGNYIQ